MYDQPEPVDYSRYKALKLSLNEGVMTVTMSNPGKRNAATPAMVDELATIWDEVWADPDVKVVVLTGEGNDFCSGVDVSQLGDTDSKGVKPVSVLNRNTRYARKHVLGILDCEKPIIAKVRGTAYGMGLTLALACDMVFVSETSRLCDSHVKVGLVAGDGGVLFWPLAVGIHRAKEYLMTGEPLSGKQADEIGLVNRALPDDQLDQHVQSIVDKLISLPPHAVNYTKASLNLALKHVTSAAFETSLAYEMYTMGMEDVTEASNAFMEKRKGRFTGN